MKLTPHHRQDRNKFRIQAENTDFHRILRHRTAPPGVAQLPEQPPPEQLPQEAGSPAVCPRFHGSLEKNLPIAREFV